MANGAGDPDSGASVEPAALKAGEKRESEWRAVLPVKTELRRYYFSKGPDLSFHSQQRGKQSYQTAQPGREKCWTINHPQGGLIRVLPPWCELSAKSGYLSGEAARWTASRCAWLPEPWVGVIFRRIQTGLESRPAACQTTGCMRNQGISLLLRIASRCSINTSSERLIMASNPA